MTKSWNYENSTNIVLNWNVLGSCSWRLYWRDGNLMVMKLQACNVVVTLSISKSWNDQKVPINDVTGTSCVNWVLLWPVGNHPECPNKHIAAH